MHEIITYAFLTSPTWLSYWTNSYSSYWTYRTSSIYYPQIDPIMRLGCKAIGMSNGMNRNLSNMTIMLLLHHLHNLLHLTDVALEITRKNVIIQLIRQPRGLRFSSISSFKVIYMQLFNILNSLDDSCYFHFYSFCNT